MALRVPNVHGSSMGAAFLSCSTYSHTSGFCHFDTLTNSVLLAHPQAEPQPVPLGLATPHLYVDGPQASQTRPVAFPNPVRVSRKNTGDPVAM